MESFVIMFVLNAQMCWGTVGTTSNGDACALTILAGMLSASKISRPPELC